MNLHIDRSLPAFGLLLLLAFPTCATAADVRGSHVTATTLPRTPGGEGLTAWLAAVNTGDREKIRRFVSERYAPPPSGALPIERIAGRILGLFESTGGLTLLKAETPSLTSMTAYLRAKRTGYCLAVSLSVSAEAPHRILGTGIREIETPAELLPARRLSERQIGRNLDALLQGLAARNAFSGVVLVAKDGRPVYRRAMGLASRAWNAPNRPNTRFNLASITKMFTAVAVAQLAEAGRLSYDDVVGEFLPDYPNRDVAQRVTVAQLLTHTSGLSDRQEALDRALRSSHPQPIGELLAPFAADPLASEPGARLRYSNLGYLLLGAIIEKASGQDYFTYVRERVFRPAGMAGTDFLELDTDPPNLAAGYMDAPGGVRRSNAFLLPVRGTPYTGAYATAGDLARFAEALRRHRLLGAGALHTLWTGRVDYHDPGSRYGYGCVVKEYNGTRIVYHGGGWVGITNRFEIYPERGYTVAILTNIDSAPNPIAYKLREWLTQGRR